MVRLNFSLFTFSFLLSTLRMRGRTQAWAALGLLTALNLFNYIDRYVLPAVQPQIKAEFHVSDAQLGFLTTSFFLCYMIAAPVMGWLADRYQRRILICAGGLVWSGATLLTYYTHTFDELLVRHTVVGIGEATFATIAGAFLADYFPEEKRGRVLGFFNIALPLGAALGYVLGGWLGTAHGWRAPFYVAALPGAALALGMLAIKEPRRGSSDSLLETQKRGTLRGLASNPAFWTATLGMAFLTFSLGGLAVWMPTFLSRVRGMSLQQANFYFGAITGVNALIASIVGGWIADRMLRRHAGANYWISGFAMAAGIPFMAIAIFVPGPLMFPAIAIGEFLMFLNAGPLNAATVNSVGAHIRSTALAVNIFVVHLLGDVPSSTAMGKVSDSSSLTMAFILALIANALSAAVLFYGARFAPKLDEAAA
jgi:predicted MFS family arabinose efflux permease